MDKEDREDLLEALAVFFKQYEVIDGLMTASDYCVYYTTITGWTADLAECAPVMPFVTAENCGIKSRDDAARALSDPELWAACFLSTNVLRAEVYQSQNEKQEVDLTRKQWQVIQKNFRGAYLIEIDGDVTDDWAAAALACVSCHPRDVEKARAAMRAAGLSDDQIPVPDDDLDDGTIGYYFNIQH